MREILFRGKRTDNGEWVYGVPAQDNYNQTVMVEGVWVWDDCDCREANCWYVEENTIGQYTGLTDKNGKKIFEGDIMDATGQWWDACGPAGYDSPIIEVKWSEDHCGFDPFANYDCDCGVYIEADGCKIIGNVHDNPELLKGVKDDV